MNPRGWGGEGLVVRSVLLFGTALRLFEYSVERSLWIDESMLALNVGRRSLGGLLAPLNYEQAAPVLFLWSVKAATLVAGMGEYALRLVPFLCGLVLPWLVWRMSREAAGPGAGLIATGLTVVSVPLIYYSAELKPYGVDACATATLILLALRVRAMPASPERWRHLTVGSVLAILASVPAPFVLAGVGAALLADSGVRGTAGAWKRLVVLVVASGMCFGLVYLALYRPASTPYMELFWANTFLDPLAPDLGERVWRTGRALADPFPPLPSFLRVRWFLLAIAAGLAIGWRRTGLPGLLLLAVPYVAVVAASALGSYAITLRLLLFLAPISFLAVAQLCWRLLRLTRMEAVPTGLAGLLLVLAWSAPSVVANGREPRVRSEVREVARFVALSAGREPVYVSPGGLPSWLYYSTDWRNPDTLRLDAIAPLATGVSHFNSLVPAPDGALPSPGPTPWGQDGTEVIGRRSGLSAREPLGMVSTTPDSGWAHDEVNRIVAVAAPYAWIYAATWAEMELPGFYEEFARRGIRIVARSSARHAVALRIRLP